MPAQARGSSFRPANWRNMEQSTEAEWQQNGSQCSSTAGPASSSTAQLEQRSLGWPAENAQQMPRDEPARTWESAGHQQWPGHTAADEGLCVTKQRFAEVNLQEAEDRPASGRRHALA